MVNKNVLKEKLSQEIPEMKKTKMMENLFSDELNTSLTDLDYDEIRAITFYKAVNNIIPLPSIMSLLNEHMKLKRSLDRKGRQEAVTILKKPVRYIPQYPYPLEQTTEGKLAKLKKIFSRGRQAEEVEA